MSSVTPPSLPPAPPETPSRRKPGGHPVLTAVAIAAVVLSSFAFLSLRSKTLKALNDLCPDWTTGFETPGDWAFLVPSAAVVAAAVAVVGLLAAVSAMKWKRGALAASLAALVAAPLLFVCAVLSLHLAFFARIGEAVAAHSEPATPAPATNAPVAAPDAPLLPTFDPAAELRALSKCDSPSVELLLEVDGIGQERFELDPALSRSVLASFGNARTERLSAGDRADGERFVIVLNLPHSELSAALESVGFGPLQTETTTGELGPDDPDQWWLHCVRLSGETNDVHVCSYSETLPSFSEARVPGLGALLHEVWEAKGQMAEKPAPLPTEEESAVRAKLDSIMIDSLEYRNANVVDVLADLGELSRELDEEESDPAKRGVNLVLGIENAEQQSLITLKARSISLGAALDLIADMTHPRINIRIVGNVVLVGTPSSIVHRMYLIGPDAASNFLGDGTDWRNRLADHGVEWPDGSSVAYLPSIGKLVVANTRKNLVRVELALGKLAPATQSPAAEEPHAESAEPATP